jgi:hypothetical protein
LVVIRHSFQALVRKHKWLSRPSSGYYFAGFIWLSSIVVGFWILLEHNTDPGRVSSAIDELNTTLVRSYVEPIPAEYLADFVPEAGTVHVIMALHPKCPCTRTTLAELEHVLALQKERAKCTFLVTLPSNESMSWIDTDTVTFAKKLPTAEIVIDVDSERANQLDLLNSGALLLLHSNGTVSFRGGITSGRTCSVENPGSRAVSDLLRGDVVDPITTPVFGCSLQ